MKRYFEGVFGVMRAYQLRFYRDKTALFFTMLFPLIFLLIFGSIFNNTSLSFNVAVIDQPTNEFSKMFTETIAQEEVFDVADDVSDFDAAKQSMQRGEIDAIILLDESFGSVGADGRPSGEVMVYTEPGSEQAGQTVAAINEQILAGIEQQFGRETAAFSVSQQSTGEAGLTQFDYTFSGLLGFTILGSAIFGLANVMPAEKQRGSFRRLRASPFRASQLILGNGLHYLIVTLLSLLLMIVVGLVVFNFEMRGSWLQFGLFASLSSIMMIGFGLLIGGWAKNESQASPVSNLVAFPLMFLSGIFFPRFLFPEWMQGLTDFIPLAPVVDGFRKIMTENAYLVDLGPELLLITAWMVGLYLLAIKFFRWGGES